MTPPSSPFFRYVTSMRNQGPLWECPQCHRTFANRNQTHTCGLYTLESHFKGKSPRIRQMFDVVLEAMNNIGPVVVLPEKTRIAFHVRMSFAQVTPRQNWLDGHLVLPRRHDNLRFRSIQTFSPRCHVHNFRLMRPTDVDQEFREWLAEAYAVGEQKHLLPRKA